MQEKAAYRHAERPPLPQEVKAAEKKQETAAVKQPDKPVTAAQPDRPVVKPPDAAPSIFSMHDSTNYYFVVNVNTATVNYNLASSRFGIGQFNRANFPAGSTITHQLINAGNDNVLIYIGRFYSLDAAKEYARAIIPLMPDIMKVPKENYSFFIITQENLNKLNNKKLLDSYIDYYQKELLK
jgi:hypothetical protein